MEIEEEELLPLQDGDVLFEALYISLDPYISLELTSNNETGVTVMGQQIARVAESRNNEFKVGDKYLALFGWRTHTIINNPSLDQKYLPELWPHIPLIRRIPDVGNLPVTWTIGSLGMPGVTAYMGLLSERELQPGETVFISGAAGTVGSVAGQIAKLKGCNVIGCAGSDEKVLWLQKLGFDQVFNYKSCDLDEALKKHAPNGIDVYLETVGGKFGCTVLQHMNFDGHVNVIGHIETYGSTTQTGYDISTILLKRLRVIGMDVYAWEKKGQLDHVVGELIQWTKEGKITSRENVIDGFEKARDTYIDFMKGRYYGKVVVKV